MNVDSRCRKTKKKWKKNRVDKTTHEIILFIILGP